MQFQLETDNHIEGRHELAAHVESVVKAAVAPYADRLTHVEAHLGDANGVEKTGSDDKRCLLEARMAGVKNVVASHHADSLHLAIDGAATKLRHALDSAVGKLHDQQRRSESLGHQSAEAIEQGAPQQP